MGGAAEVLLRSLRHLATPVQCLTGSCFNPPNKREAVPSGDSLSKIIFSRSHLRFYDRICGFTIAFAVLRSHLRFYDRICGFAIASAVL
ncbi:MAG: hypothetical protein F6J86_42955 [Symploca sp. SIO1B1]|nr:hypothetical protein [Symploca sp. SIO1B1]